MERVRTGPPLQNLWTLVLFFMPFIEPTVLSLHFVSHSALLCEFVAVSVPGPFVVPYCVRLRPYATHCPILHLCSFV